MLQLVLPGPRVIGTAENGNGVAVFPAEAHGEPLLGPLAELGGQGVLVGRGRVVVAAWD